MIVSKEELNVSPLGKNSAIDFRAKQLKKSFINDLLESIKVEVSDYSDHEVELSTTIIALNDDFFHKIIAELNLISIILTGISQLKVTELIKKLEENVK